MAANIWNKILNKKHTFVIAEAGVNHNGNLRIAKKLVYQAKKCGADAIKFQTFIAEQLATNSVPQAQYQSRTAKASSQKAMLKKLELPFNHFKKIKEYCKQQRITFLSTPFDEESAEFLNKLSVPLFKLGSGEITNIPLLKKIAAFKKPIILSTGMANIKEIREAIQAIRKKGNTKIILLHCTSSYPTAPQDVHLRAISTMQKEFNLPVGYSDHTQGLAVPLAAVALGAQCIEKHFTLNKKMKGPDHQASSSPEEFAQLIKSIREVEQALGSPKKRPTAEELRTMKVVRKSLVANQDIKKGTRLKREMIAIKRPGTGIPPKYIDQIINKVLSKSVKKDTLLTRRNLKR